MQLQPSSRGILHIGDQILPKKNRGAANEEIMKH